MEQQKHLINTDSITILIRIKAGADMDTKLTLKLDKQVIEKAKEYAASHKRSLSRLIEAYLKSLVDTEMSADKDDIQISPFIKNMATGVKLSADLDHKKEYGNHLSEKYK